VPTRGEISEEEIDVVLADSYPASDPPSWTLGSESHDILIEQERQEKESISR